MVNGEFVGEEEKRRDWRSDVEIDFSIDRKWD